MATNELAPSVWNEIYRVIQNGAAARAVYQGVVTDRDPTRNFVWVRELSSDPIEVVGHSHDLVVFHGTQRAVTKIPPAVPEIGDVVLLLRTASDVFKCIGVLATTSKWVPDAGMGLSSALFLPGYKIESRNDIIWVTRTVPDLGQWAYLMLVGNGPAAGAGIGFQPDGGSTSGDHQYEFYVDATGIDGLHVYSGEMPGDIMAFMRDCGGAGKPGIGFGSSFDTNIYRDAADVIKTDDTFNAVAGLQKNGQSVVAAGDVAGGALSGTFPNPQLAVGIEGSKLNYHVGASPPGSPSIGDLWLCTTPTSAGYNVWSARWLFMYTNVDTTYPWQLIGGIPAISSDMVDRSASLTASAFLSPYATDPNMDLARPGNYLVTFGATIRPVTSAASIGLGLRFGTTDPVFDGQWFTGGYCPVAASRASLNGTTTISMPSVAAGASHIQLRYWQNGGTQNLARNNAYISVIPYNVS